MDDLLLLPTPADVERLLGQRLRASRKAKGWTQAELSRRAGLSVATVARLERSGHGQLSSLILAMAALGRLRDFEALLEPPGPRTLQELREQRGGDG